MRDHDQTPMHFLLQRRIRYCAPTLITTTLQENFINIMLRFREEMT